MTKNKHQDSVSITQKPTIVEIGRADIGKKYVRGELSYGMSFQTEFGIGKQPSRIAINRTDKLE